MLSRSRFQLETTARLSCGLNCASHGNVYTLLTVDLGVCHGQHSTQIPIDSRVLLWVDIADIMFYWHTLKARCCPIVTVASNQTRKASVMSIAVNLLWRGSVTKWVGITLIAWIGVLDYLEHIHRPENRIILLHVIELPDLAHASEFYDNRL